MRLRSATAAVMSTTTASARSVYRIVDATLSQAPSQAEVVVRSRVDSESGWGMTMGRRLLSCGSEPSGWIWAQWTRRNQRTRRAGRAVVSPL